eukprot:1076370_1
MSAIRRIDNLLEILIDKKTEHKLDKEYDDIETTIIYMKDTGKRYVIDMRPSEASSELSAKGIITKVHNGHHTNCTFRSHGFQLINQFTTLNTKDFYMNPNDKIQHVYYKEIESTIKTLTGAQFVKAFEHQVRSTGSTPEYATVSVGVAAHGAHVDFTQYSALNAFQTVLPDVPKDGNDYTKGRFAIINVWRNISDTNAIQNYHLAMMDARTAMAPDDFIKYDYVPPNGAYRVESYYLNASSAAHHEWYYFPAMNKNELLVFMQYDSDFHSQSRHVFHTAIYDPTYDDSNNTDFSRESIELRLAAFFPTHSPNTIPILEALSKSKRKRQDATCVYISRAKKGNHMRSKTLYNIRL